MKDKDKTKEPLTQELAHLSGALGILLSVLVLSLGDLMEVIPLFTPVVASPFFPFFHEIHDLLALGVVLYAAYKYHARLAVAAILVYFAAHIPYAIAELPENAPELLRIFFGVFVSFLGVGLIDRLHKSEEKLSVSEERYRTLVDNALVGVYRTNLKGDILYVNDTLVSMLGFDSAEEMIAGGAVVRYKNPNDRAILLKELTEKGRVNSFEFEVLTKTGEIKNVILSAVLEGDTLSGMLVDITERKRAEERIIHLTAVLRAIRNVNQLITREKDRQNLIQKSCDLLVQRQGYEKAWILLLDENRNFVTVASTGLGENAPAFLKQLETGNYPVCLRELLAQEQPFIAYDQPGKRHEGCILAGEHSRQGVFRCKLEHEGKFYGILGVALPSGAVSDKDEQDLFHELCSDIAFALANIEREEKRQQAEEQIEQTAREWQTTFDSISDWVSVHDKDFKIIRVNKAFADFLKMKPEEIIGRHCYELIHGEKEASQYCSHKEALKTGKPAYTEFYNPHLGIHMEVVCSPIFNERGEITTTVHIGRDITEHKKMEAQMMATDRLASIGELASGIAHELNNPLTGVIGFSELLLEKDAPDDVKEDLMVINREAKRAAGVVRNLLTFARKHPPEKQAVNINNAIKLVLELRAYEEKINNIEVNTQLAADLPEVMTDSFQLQQVFLNIIINAEYFMIEAHKRGTLTITTERVGDIIRVSLADDGPGIAQENLEHIFDPFFTTKEAGKGTGLGLSICHGIVTGHGGRIYAESELGKGAAFIIELPISQ